MRAGTPTLSALPVTGRYQEPNLRDVSRRFRLGIVVFAKAHDFFPLDPKDVCPVVLIRASSGLHLPLLMSEDNDFVSTPDEFLRLKLLGFLRLGELGEELGNLLASSPRSHKGNDVPGPWYEPVNLLAKRFEQFGNISFHKTLIRFAHHCDVLLRIHLVLLSVFIA